MKKPLIIFAAIVMLIIVLLLANREKDLSAADLKKIIAMKPELERYCSSSKPDFEFIDKFYRSGLRKIVIWTDNATGIKMDNKIKESIEQGNNGSIPEINAQIIDLTVTRVFYEYFLAHINNFSDKPNIDRARAVLEGLKPVVEAADMFANLDGGLAKEFSAVSADPVSNTKKVIDILQAALLINIADELDMAEAGNQNASVYFFHLARAVQFFHVLYQDISVRNREDAVFIYGELRKKPDQIDFPDLRKKLYTGFSKLPFIRPELFKQQ